MQKKTGGNRKNCVGVYKRGGWKLIREEGRGPRGPFESSANSKKRIVKTILGHLLQQENPFLGQKKKNPY